MAKREGEEGGDGSLQCDTISWRSVLRLEMRRTERCLAFTRCLHSVVGNDTKNVDVGWKLLYWVANHPMTIFRFQN